MCDLGIGEEPRECGSSSLDIEEAGHNPFYFYLTRSNVGTFILHTVYGQIVFM